MYRTSMHKAAALNIIQEMNHAGRKNIQITAVQAGFTTSQTILMSLAAFGVTDESFAIFTTEKEEHRSVYFFLGLISVTYTSWIAGSAIGVDFLLLQFPG